MKNIVLISYTPLNAGGGVPRWNRDFIAGFPGTKHYSWENIRSEVLGGRDIDNTPEWDKVRVLNQWLIWTKGVTKDNIILVDGFWGLGLEEYDVISVCHGNWSHTTLDDVKKGILPEFPQHHAVQVQQRRDHLARGGKLVAVSTFIAEQMMLQWGFKSEVIDNGIDTDKFKPVEKKSSNGEFFDGRLIIHGTTTVNKGFDHIEAVRRVCPNDQVLSLDEAAEFLKMSKYEALANADLVVHPSAHEGNSYFVLETLACGIPLISYNVGLMYHSWRDNQKAAYVLDRNERSPEKTAAAVVEFFDKGPPYKLRPRAFAEQHSIQQFHDDWKEYLIDHESSNETSNKSR